MIDVLVPAGLATAETRVDLRDVALYPEEARTVRDAVEKRVREFTNGRGCARLALRQLSIPRTPIPTGIRGEPCWPEGIVGSITHCRGYCASAVASSDVVRAVGIDAEPNEPLPAGVLRLVASPEERARLADAADGHAAARVCFDRLLFSAKEAIYKAWFPFAARPPGFGDVTLFISSDAGTFHGRILINGPMVDGVRLTAFDGHWRMEAGVIATAVVLHALPRPASGAARGWLDGCRQG